MATISAEAAISLIKANPAAYQTAESLSNLVSHLDVAANGAVTVFYGGKLNGQNAVDIVDGLVRQGADIRVLDKTQVYSFLVSDTFKDAVAKAFGTTLDDLAGW